LQHVNFGPDRHLLLLFQLLHTAERFLGHLAGAGPGWLHGYLHSSRLGLRHLRRFANQPQGVGFLGSLLGYHLSLSLGLSLDLHLAARVAADHFDVFQTVAGAAGRQQGQR